MLEGGADRWVRKYYDRCDLVEAFDDDYWGFSCNSSSISSSISSISNGSIVNSISSSSSSSSSDACDKCGVQVGAKNAAIIGTI